MLEIRLLVVATLVTLLLPGCNKPPKSKAAPAPQAQAQAQAQAEPEPEIQASQLYGRWRLVSMDGGPVDRTLVESHELEFSPDTVRSQFLSGSRASGQRLGGTYPWRLSGSTLTLDRGKGAMYSTRISVDGNHPVILPVSPFFVPTDFQRMTVAYRKDP